MSRRVMQGALGAALAWFAIGSAAIAATDADRLIIPGKSIGPVALGATVAEVEAKLGRPDDVRVVDTYHLLLQWREPSLVVGVEQDRVVLVGTNSTRYQTSTGLQVGVPGERALVMFPGLKAPKAKGIFGLSDDVMGINFLSHTGRNPAAKPAPLQAGWLIDEINVYMASSERATDRKKP